MWQRLPTAVDDACEHPLLHIFEDLFLRRMRELKWGGGGGRDSARAKTREKHRQMRNIKQAYVKEQDTPKTARIQNTLTCFLSSIRRTPLLAANNLCDSISCSFFRCLIFAIALFSSYVECRDKC
jgi:hypothetical protein